MSEASIFIAIPEGRWLHLEWETVLRGYKLQDQSVQYGHPRTVNILLVLRHVFIYLDAVRSALFIKNLALYHLCEMFIVRYKYFGEELRTCVIGCQ